jgi:hypothetical protein
MASPYATLAGVLQGDVANLEGAFFDHTSRHRCRADSGCEARRLLTDALTSVRAMLVGEADRGEALSGWLADVLGWGSGTPRRLLALQGTGSWLSTCSARPGPDAPLAH